MYENIRVPPLRSTYTWLNLIYYSMIFLFTDNNDVVSQTANCDFLGVQARWSEYRLVTCHRLG